MGLAMGQIGSQLSVRPFITYLWLCVHTCIAEPTFKTTMTATQSDTDSSSCSMALMVNEFRISHMTKYVVFLENSLERPSLECCQTIYLMCISIP